MHDGGVCCRQLTVLEQKMNSDVMTILQIVRESKLQRASSPPAAEDADSSSGALPSQTVDGSRVQLRVLPTALVAE